MYPKMTVYLNRIEDNARYVCELAAENGVRITGVVKSSDNYSNSYKAIAEAMKRGGVASLADSRMKTIERMRELGVEDHILLLRIPQMWELPKVVEFADASLQSDPGTLAALEEEAAAQEKTHGVILMTDLGDLREGIFDPDVFHETAVWIERELPHLHLLGIGTNLGCYGSIVPDVTNLSLLVERARAIEKSIGRKLEIVSGGGTSTLPMLLDRTLPEGINHLRVGEGILLGRDLVTIWKLPFDGLRMDTYVVEAQIVEIEEKPSYPIGRIFVDAFGNTPEYIDSGMRMKAIVAIGKRDIGSHDALFPIDETIKVLGGSSDHLILDITDCKVPMSVGDIVAFLPNYQALVNCIESSDVTILHHFD